MWPRRKRKMGKKLESGRRSQRDEEKRDFFAFLTQSRVTYPGRNTSSLFSFFLCLSPLQFVCFSRETLRERQVSVFATVTLVISSFSAVMAVDPFSQSLVIFYGIVLLWGTFFFLSFVSHWRDCPFIVDTQQVPHAVKKNVFGLFSSLFGCLFPKQIENNTGTAKKRAFPRI